MSKVVIIGSGFGGLSSAIHLASQGHQVKVYEKNDQLGGRAGLLEDAGFRRDMGPSRYLMPDLFEDFFTQFGKRREDYLTITQLDPSYRIFFKGREAPVDITDTVEKNRAMFESLEPGSTDQLHAYLERSKYQYEVAMKGFVKKNYDSIFDFLTPQMAIEGSRLHVFEKMDKYVKRRFKTSEMQKIMQYPLVFLGTAPKDAPALYNIMSWVDFGMGVYYPDGGIRSIVDALVLLAQEYGVQFHTGSEVAKIEVTNKKATGVHLVDGSFVQADHVVSNADYRWTETHLLDPKRQTYKQSYREKRTMAPSGFILYLGVQGRIENLQHHTLLFSEDRDHNFGQIFDEHVPPTDPSLYICCPSKTDLTVAPADHENLFVLVPFPPGVEQTEAEIQAYRDKILTDVELTIGETFQDRIVVEHRFTVRDFQERYHAYKGSALGLAHTLWQTALLRPNTISKKVKNLYYAGGYTNPGIGMPMCLISGQLVYQRIGPA